MTTKDTAVQTIPQQDEKNDLVLVQLDRPREVRFGHKSLKMLSVLLGKNMAQFDESEIDLGDIEKVMFCGLLQDSKEQMKI